MSKCIELLQSGGKKDIINLCKFLKNANQLRKEIINNIHIE